MKLLEAILKISRQAGNISKVSRSLEVIGRALDELKELEIIWSKEPEMKVVKLEKPAKNEPKKKVEHDS